MVSLTDTLSAILRQSLASLAAPDGVAAYMRAVAKEDETAHLEPSRRILDAFPRSAIWPALRSSARVPYPPKRFVYIIRSVNQPDRRYIGVSADVLARLAAHNAGQNRSTAAWRPWMVDISVEFRTERMALRFERYLKSGSGHEFAKRHFDDEGH